LLSPISHGFSSVFRVLGTAANSQLISKMYWYRHRGEIHDLQVAPLPKQPADVQNDPAHILFNCRRIAAAPSCGGWESLSPAGLTTYAIIDELQSARMFSLKCRRLLSLHPAYKAASFIPTLNEAALAELIRIIVDPRRFVDSRVPDKPSKMSLYLGLTPAAQRRVTKRGYGNGHELFHHAARLDRFRDQYCATVLDCWRSRDISERDLTDPANFLLRVYAAAGGGYRGDLRASQVFLRYIAQNWLAGLSQRPGSCDKIFAPDLFFKSDAEVSAYAQHMAKSDAEKA
jgi:hypothetical protein